MFGRHVTLQIKRNFETEFPLVIENEILPLLRRQKGFLEEVVMVAPERSEAIAISLWETKEYADIYNREFYPEVVKILNKFIVGAPLVKPFEVQYATLPTFQKYATVAAH